MRYLHYIILALLLTACSHARYQVIVDTQPEPLAAPEPIPGPAVEPEPIVEPLPPMEPQPLIEPIEPEPVNPIKPEVEPELSLMIIEGNLSDSCSFGGVCDKQTFSQYVYEEGNNRLVFHFTPKLHDPTLIDIKGLLDYLSVGQRYTEEGEDPMVSSGATLHDVTFTSLEDGVLEGYAQFTFTEKVTTFMQSDDPACRTGDMMGYCTMTEDVNIPTHLQFTLRLP